MPRCINRNPRYSKHKASGQAVVTIGGRDHYLGPWKSKASFLEYDRLISEWIASGRRGPSSSVQPLTVAELIEGYWDFVNTYYRHKDGTPTSEIFPMKAALRSLNGLYGLTKAANFGPLALDRIRNTMISNGWCRSTINNHVARIKGLFKWGVARELIPGSVYHTLQAVSGLRAGRSNARESQPVRPVSNEVVAATLAHLTHVVAAMVQIQSLTGARPGEICSMRIDQIDRSEEIWIFTPASHKTAHHGHHRTIFIGPKARQILQPFLQNPDPGAFVFSPTDSVAEMRERRSYARSTPMNCGNIPGSNVKRRPKRKAHEYYTVPSYRRAITRAVDKADLWTKGGKVIANNNRVIPRWHPHQLRHSAATEIRKRFGIEAAQLVLGHSTLASTEVYAERDAEAAREVAAQIG
jgi:integrase